MEREEIKYTENEEVEEDVYSEEGREKLVEDAEIEPWEEGFMQGAENDGQGAKCRKCGKILMGAEDIVEKEIANETYRFCSDYCAEKFEEKRK
jgi:hypothetical protein